MQALLLFLTLNLQNLTSLSVFNNTMLFDFRNYVKDAPEGAPA